MTSRIAELTSEAVPCWAGTGLRPLPAGFSGDCDDHDLVPKLPCDTPDVWAPGWCVAPPTPSPPPVPSLDCPKETSDFCDHAGFACGGHSTDIHKGNESTAVCQQICLSMDACDCFDISEIEGKAHCKVYSGTTLLKPKDGLTSYVRGSGISPRLV